MPFNDLTNVIIVDFSKKTWSWRIKHKSWKIRYLWRRSRGTFTFFWERSRMDGKEVLQEYISVWENLLCNIYFLLIKFSRISCIGLHLYPFLLFIQMLIKYLKINVVYEWTALSRQSFGHGFTSLFIVKARGSMTISPWLSFSRKIQTFFLLPTSSPNLLCTTFSESHSF